MKKHNKKIVHITGKKSLPSRTVVIFGGFFLILGCILVLAVNQGRRGYRSLINSTTVWTESGSTSLNSDKIEERGSCYKVASNTCTNDVFIPTSTSPERSGFIANHPACIQLTGCTTPNPNNPYCLLDDITICNSGSTVCQTWAACNSDIGSSGYYYPGIPATGKNASGWLYGRLYPSDFIFYNSGQVCAPGYHIPTSGEMDTLINTISTCGTAYDWVDTQLLEEPPCTQNFIDNLKLPIPGFYNFSVPVGYKQHDIEGVYYLWPLQRAPRGAFNGLAILNDNIDGLQSVLFYPDSYTLWGTYQYAAVDIGDYLTSPDQASVRCMKDVVQKTYTCPEKPIGIGYVWNSVSSYVQTFQLGARSPVDDPVTEYNATASTTSCRFKCDTANNYHWNGSSCIYCACPGYWNGSSCIDHRVDWAGGSYPWQIGPYYYATGEGWYQTPPGYAPWNCIHTDPWPRYYAEGCGPDSYRQQATCERRNHLITYPEGTYSADGYYRIFIPYDTWHATARSP